MSDDDYNNPTASPVSKPPIESESGTENEPEPGTENESESETELEAELGDEPRPETSKGRPRANIDADDLGDSSHPDNHEGDRNADSIPSQADSDDPDQSNRTGAERWKAYRYGHGQTARYWETEPYPLDLDIDTEGDVNVEITIQVNEKEDSLLQKASSYIGSLIRDRILTVGLGLTVLNLIWTVVQIGAV